MEGRDAATGGRRRRPGLSTAVEKRDHMRKREAFFGHRKVEGVVVSNGTPSRQPWHTL